MGVYALMNMCVSLMHLCEEDIQREFASCK